MLSSLWRNRPLSYLRLRTLRLSIFNSCHYAPMNRGLVLLHRNTPPRTLPDMPACAIPRGSERDNAGSWQARQTNIFTSSSLTTLQRRPNRPIKVRPAFPQHGIATRLRDRNVAKNVRGHSSTDPWQQLFWTDLLVCASSTCVSGSCLGYIWRSDSGNHQKPRHRGLFCQRKASNDIKRRYRPLSYTHSLP